MGTLTCQRCKATTKADSIEDGRKLLDHSVGLYIGKPCQDGRAELFLTGVEPKKAKKIDNKAKSLLD